MTMLRYRTKRRNIRPTKGPLPLIEYRWEVDICCSLCNPINLVELRTSGVRILGPGMSGPGGVDCAVCEGCLALLDSMAFVDLHAIPSHPLVMNALGLREPLQKPRLKIRNQRSLAKSAMHNALEHRAGLRVAILSLAEDWRAEALEHAERGDKEAAEDLYERASELEQRAGRDPQPEINRCALTSG